LPKQKCKALPTLQELGIEVKALPSKHTVYFENIYGENQDNRTQRVLQKADAFSVADLADTEAIIFHLGPLLADDIPTELIKNLFGRGNVSCDAQGYLREVIEKGVHAIDWADKKEALQYIDVLKVNEHELEVLTGTSRHCRRCADPERMGCKRSGDHPRQHGFGNFLRPYLLRDPAYKPTEVVDATGCGDTYMAGYLYRRIKGDDVYEAGKFASAMAGLKIENAGPFKGQRKR
jgi:sugar/nucleoside kinase (ribokinase family)